MIASALAAIGITPPLSFEERRAHVAKEQARLENERAAKEQAINESRSTLNAKARAQIEKIATDAEAFEITLSAELAAEFRKYAVPLFEQYTKQPSRKIAKALSSNILETRIKVKSQLGADLDTLQICTCFAETLLHSDDNLLSTFHHSEAFHGEPISAATALIAATDGDFISAFESALTRLERALEHVAATAPNSKPTPAHEHCFETLCLHATARHRADATQAIVHAYAGDSAAKTAAEYRRPRNVHTEGNVGISGTPSVVSRVEYDEPAAAAAAAAAPSREEDGDTVETLSVDFEKLGSVDFEKLGNKRPRSRRAPQTGKSCDLEPPVASFPARRVARPTFLGL